MKRRQIMCRRQSIQADASHENEPWRNKVDRDRLDSEHTTRVSEGRAPIVEVDWVVVIGLCVYMTAL